MKSKPKKPAEAPFTLGANDRFHAILCSHPICFNDKSKAEVILTFFIIRRGDDSYTICNVNRTYNAKGNCITRSVRTKDSIHASRIEQEVQDIREKFAKGVEAGSGRKLEWDYLDLRDIVQIRKQIRAISTWGRIGVSIPDIPPISPN